MGSMVRKVFIWFVGATALLFSSAVEAHGVDPGRLIVRNVAMVP